MWGGGKIGGEYREKRSLFITCFPWRAMAVMTSTLLWWIRQTSEPMLLLPERISSEAAQRNRCPTWILRPLLGPHLGCSQLTFLRSAWVCMCVSVRACVCACGTLFRNKQGQWYLGKPAHFGQECSDPMNTSQKTSGPGSGRSGKVCCFLIDHNVCVTKLITVGKQEKNICRCYWEAGASLPFTLYFGAFYFRGLL